MSTRDDASIISTDVGFSDRVLLGIALGVFFGLALSVYFLVIRRLKSREEVEKEDLTHDELLARADVSTLNRAQRRARAKAIMKEQRRAAATQPDGHAQQDEDGEHQQADEQQEDVNADRQPKLSRKQRQQAAKAAEKEERRLYQEERQKIQKAALQKAAQEKKARLEAAAKEAEEKKKRQQLESEQKEKEELEAYLTFLTAGPHATVATQSVEEFVKNLKQDRIVRIEETATAFDVPVNDVISRIQDLVDDGRVAGFFQPGRFVYVSEHELNSIAQQITERGSVSLNEVAKICETMLQE
jgi:MFS superfamily sulfate permease-like transporter